LTTSVSAALGAAERVRHAGTIAITPAYAASTCSQMPSASQTSAISLHRIDGRRRGRADGGDDGQRHDAGAAIGGNGLAQQVDAHRVLGVAREWAIASFPSPSRIT
jgi:hypothetical protein